MQKNIDILARRHKVGKYHRIITKNHPKIHCLNLLQNSRFDTFTVPNTDTAFEQFILRKYVNKY